MCAPPAPNVVSRPGQHVAPSKKARAIVAASLAGSLLTIGLVTTRSGSGAGDFGYAFMAARWLLSGGDPYAAMDPAAAYGRGGPFLYPLPAAVVAAPFAPFPTHVAAVAFLALGIGIFAYAITARGWWGLLALASAPAVMTVMSVNWGFLLVSAALLPGLTWLAAVKPNLGLVALGYRWNWRSAAACIGFGALTLLALPSWPLSWLTHLERQPVAHVPILLWPFGALGLVGLLRWRTPEGRALLTYTLVPVSIVPSDHMMLWLIPRTGGEMIALTASSWLLLPVLLGFIPGADPVPPATIRLLSVVALIVPCAVIVWRQRNERAIPSASSAPASSLE
jgi:hypothetical protein